MSPWSHSLPSWIAAVAPRCSTGLTIKRLGCQGQALPLTCCVTLGNKVPLWASVFLSANVRGLYQMLFQTSSF